MSESSNDTMNLKLNNDVKTINTVKSRESIIKERRRTGRYIAILVGILLFILAFYHAWVRRIPVVASLVVPALIMFVYVAWVLYTASRDKLKMLDLEAAMNAAAAEAAENDAQSTGSAQNNIEISVISNKSNSSSNSPDDNNKTEISFVKEKNIRTEVEHNVLTMPIILVNDKPPEDLDQKWLNIVQTVTNSEKFKGFHTRRKFKRKFCRSRRHAVFKRSYSIG
ncbi:uncharacterized protein LOC115454263 isoform X2 [Manduca sexta]|uniref:uncharacterized protein LOC115454263 isoform X2 n=1 Tax=Manduca sexta TaxID=7130 RepID=UPI001183CA43|nr:uncharacterized protein LOC115454263 isoform X2 [Manduca sexta]